MKPYNWLKAEAETIQRQIVGVKKRRRIDALKEVKEPCKESSFIIGSFKSLLVEGTAEMMWSNA